MQEMEYTIVYGRARSLDGAANELAACVAEFLARGGQVLGGFAAFNDGAGFFMAQPMLTPVCEPTAPPAEETTAEETSDAG